MTHPVLAAINLAIEQSQEDGLRAHLGASLIGQECGRQVWYNFRWFSNIRHAARLLRLFNRGAKEEDRFIEWLTAAGITVFPLDPETNKQWRISDKSGHFGGSLDAIIQNVPGLDAFGLAADTKILAEFKTHNDKSFSNLTAVGVKKAKPEHYTQMQCYMLARELPLALYLAINKNTDEIHAEFVPHDRNHALDVFRRAEHLVFSQFPPPRISNDPSWFKCRFCEYKKICHMREAPQINCRTCANSKPISEGQWWCNVWNSVIPLEAQKRGCEHHKHIGE